MLFLAELRKLLSVRLLLIAVVLSALYGDVFLAPALDQLRTNHSTLESHEIALRAVDDFGAEISDSEYRVWSRQYESLERDADSLIRADPTLRELGVDSWDGLSEVAFEEDDARAEAAYRASKPLFFEVSPGRAGLGFTLQAFQDQLDRYASVRDRGIEALPHATAAERRHSQARLEAGAWRAIQDQGVIEATFEFTRALGILVVLVVLLVTAPLPVTDTVRRMRSVQYASRRGRSVFTAQFLATISAALVAGFIACAAAALGFNSIQVGPFLGNSLWSDMNPYLQRVDQTLLEALTLSAVVLVLIAVATGGIAFALARWSNHYIGLLVRLVVAFAALVTVVQNVLQTPFTFSNPIWRYVRVPYVELVAAALLVSVALLVCVLLVRRERIRDLV